MSRILFATMLLITVVGTCGCQWDQRGAQADGPLIAAVDVHVIGYNPPRWSRDLGLGESDRLTQATLLGDLIVCVERPSNIVSCISVRDGSVVWQRRPAKITERLFEPVRLEDEILVNSETVLYQLAVKDGRTKGISNLEATVADRPALIGRSAVFGGLSGRVFAHSSVSGHSIWSQDMSAGIMVRPAASGYNAFVADSNGAYGMFETNRGQALWKGETYGQISAAPTVTSLGVFVACEDQTLYALDRSSGEDLWKYMAGKPLKSSPVVIGNTLFLGEPGKGLVAMDAITGQWLWTKDTTAMPIAIVGRRLLLNDHTSLLAIDPESGTTVAEIDTAPLKMVLTGPDNSLILVAADGRLTRIDPQR